MNTPLTGFVADADAKVSGEFSVADGSNAVSGAKSAPVVTTGPSFIAAAAADADLLAPTLRLADSSVTCLTDADIRGVAECQGRSRGSENDSGSSEDGSGGVELGSGASVLMALATTGALVR